MERRGSGEGCRAVPRHGSLSPALTHPPPFPFSLPRFPTISVLHSRPPSLGPGSRATRTCCSLLWGEWRSGSKFSSRSRVGIGEEPAIT